MQIVGLRFYHYIFVRVNKADEPAVRGRSSGKGVVWSVSDKACDLVEELAYKQGPERKGLFGWRN